MRCPPLSLPRWLCREACAFACDVLSIARRRGGCKFGATPMYTPDDIQYAMETTRVLHEPDRRIDTFGSTRFEFRVLSELMDRTGEVRIRSGEMEASKPLILRPEALTGVDLEGFGPGTRERLDALVDRLRADGHDLAFLQYGFQFRRGGVSEEIVHDHFDNVSARVVAAARQAGNPMEAVIAGVDDAWEVSVLKFAFEMILKSRAINLFDFKRKGLL